MDIDTQNKPPRKKRRNLKRILDSNLTPKQRKAAISLLDSESVKEVTNRAGVGDGYLRMQDQESPVYGMKATQLLARGAAMDKIVAFCEDILSREIETPLKASDKVAAARLLADITGNVHKQASTNINIGVLDLRHATSEQLAQELARIEKESPSIIDATPEDDAVDEDMLE